jgi:hypothetical protein
MAALLRSAKRSKSPSTFTDRKLKLAYRKPTSRGRFTFQKSFGVTIRTVAHTGARPSASMNAMKSPSRVVLISLALTLAFAVRAQAQNGSIQFEAHVRPSGGSDEPVRSFSFYLLRRSYAEIQAEAIAAAPAARMEDFIDKLDVSKELKAWMKKNQCVSLSGEDFLKKLKADDIMNVPEFNSAYLDRMAGDQTVQFPAPKYKDSDKVKDPDKYAAQVKLYHDQIRQFFVENPSSISGIDMELEAVDPGHKWDVIQAKSKARLDHETLILAEGKYLVARTETDLDGRGFFRSIPQGTYWLSSLNVSSLSGDERELWDTPVAVVAGKQTNISLSNINAVQPATSAP